jgi:hypothetical protein
VETGLFGWYQQNSIFYLDSHSHNLYAFNLESKQSLLLQTNITHAQYEQGSWYLTKTNQQHIARYDDEFNLLDSVYDLTRLSERADNIWWRVEQGALYLVEQYTQQDDVLYSVNANGELQQLFSSQTLYANGLQITAGGQLVLTYTSSNESNIIRLSIQP